MNDDIIKDVAGTTFSVRTMNGGYRKFTVEDIFGIDDTDISKEYVQQAAIYGFFAVAMTSAEDVANRAEFDKDQEYAAADVDARQRMENNGMKYTEAVIKSMILQDEAYHNSMQREFKTQLDFKLLKVIVKALEQRADMLVSLGSHLRHESTMTGMSVREREVEDLQKRVKSVLKQHKDVRPAPSEPGRIGQV